MLLLRVAGWEGHAQESPFPATSDAIPDVEEWHFQQGSILDDQDPSFLFHEEKPPAPISSVGNVRRFSDNRDLFADRNSRPGGIDS
jgi:hypothetical protein